MSETTRPPNDDDALLVHAYVDGELDPAHSLAVERQLTRQSGARRRTRAIEALRQRSA